MLGGEKQCKRTFWFAATRKLAEPGVLCDFLLRRIVRWSRNYFLVFLLRREVLGMVEDKQVRRAEQHPAKHSAHKSQVSSHEHQHVVI